MQERVKCTDKKDTSSNYVYKKKLLLFHFREKNQYGVAFYVQYGTKRRYTTERECS